MSDALQEANQIPRLGEPQTTPPIRSQRFFKLDYFWYYTTREGVNIGPFDSQAEAEAGCLEFISFVTETDPGFSDVLKYYAGNTASFH